MEGEEISLAILGLRYVYLRRLRIFYQVTTQLLIIRYFCKVGLTNFFVLNWFVKEPIRFSVSYDIYLVFVLSRLI